MSTLIQVGGFYPWGDPGARPGFGKAKGFFFFFKPAGCEDSHPTSYEKNHSARFRDDATRSNRGISSSRRNNTGAPETKSVAPDASEANGSNRPEFRINEY